MADRTWRCVDCGTSDHTREKTNRGPRCERCTLIAIDKGELCGLVISDGLEGSGTGGRCRLLAGHDSGHSVRG
ncbi:hypothetical protein GS640_01090 [Rhodococcus hoagii]|nr:hypothetical protein [Prescottella equi]